MGKQVQQYDNEVEAKRNDRQYCCNYIRMRKQTLSMYEQTWIDKIILSPVLNQRATNPPAVNSHLNVRLSKTL